MYCMGCLLKKGIYEHAVFGPYDVVMYKGVYGASGLAIKLFCLVRTKRAIPVFIKRSTGAGERARKPRNSFILRLGIMRALPLRKPLTVSLTHFSTEINRKEGGANCSALGKFQNAVRTGPG